MSLPTRTRQTGIPIEAPTVDRLTLSMYRLTSVFEFGREANRTGSEVLKSTVLLSLIAIFLASVFILILTFFRN